MADVDIIELRKTENGEKFYPVTHVEAIVGLSDYFGSYLTESEFNTWKASSGAAIRVGSASILPGASATLSEIGIPTWAQASSPSLYVGNTAVQTSAAPQALVGIISIKKDASIAESLFEWDADRNAWHFYGNLYANGWISAGGIGSGGGGGGGGASVLNDLEDVSCPSPSNNDLLVYDTSVNNGTWVNKPQSSIVPTVTVTDYGATLTAGQTITLATVSGTNITAVVPQFLLTEQYTGTVTSVTLKSGTGITVNNSGTAITTTGTRTISISSSYITMIENGDNAYSILQSSATRNYVFAAPSDSNGTPSFRQLVASDLPDVSDTYVTIAGTQTISGTKSFSAHVAMLGTNLNFKNAANNTTYASFQAGATYLQANVGSGHYMFYPDSGFFFHNGGVECGKASHRWSNVYSVAGNFSGDLTVAGAVIVNSITIGSAVLSYNSSRTALALSGSGVGISVSSDSFIDIGDARLSYNATSKALHVTKRSGVSYTIGLYADGFVSAGGTVADTVYSYVTTDTDQIIAGVKTFTDNVVMNYALTVNGAINDLNIYKSGSYEYINYTANRLYIQGAKDLVLCSGAGKVVIGSYTSSSYKLYVNGEAGATAWNTTSDRRLKNSVLGISGAAAIDVIMRLKPSTWTWNSGDSKGKFAAGLIAQDVEEVLPFAVNGGEFKTLNYQTFHAYELSAIQDHEKRITRLEKTVFDK